MTESTHHRAIHWVLLCVLFLGVVGMHHVAVSDDMSPTHGSMSVGAYDAPPTEEPAPQPAHEMLHLCVAVLCAVVSLLLLGWLLLRAERPIAGRILASVAWPRAPDRPPPRGGRDLLSSLCVLRL
ncbi:hypothetical protein SAMN04488074_11969 [Lentzea albidocapillata subsp. violacea]|uniref:Uncharacterized protein n=2 Tax=Lentzea TaxID=165301 RepID=A0A1G9RYY8_9PSEU|nr:hypothetical protein [Lentzea sp. BCCO 10_0061]MDX8143226.1 hypothetical protein [Lentzea sp. BCCO 10_0061]SDM28451.1 hypothetical protein SAMN04488074_11969 [Lentzea albidocapillata subsp. violacea]